MWYALLIGEDTCVWLPVLKLLPPCRLDWIVLSPICGTFSIMSISPHAGHDVPFMMELPSIQKAGQSPSPYGNCMRASIKPYCVETFGYERRRADVYVLPTGKAVMIKWPLPS